MAEILNHLDTPSDAELISRVRGGEVDAYGELFARHVGAARRLARQLVRGPDSDDLVSEAFTKVMGVLQSGGGPDIAFRAYLLTAVRRLHVDRMRAQTRVTPSGDLSDVDPGIPFQDTVVEQFETGAAARAFGTLPERWQMVLWHLEVERQKPADIAPLLGMTPNSVSALAYRAREGLRQAFLSAHLAEIEQDNCRWTVDHLGGFVRKGLSRRDATKVESHLHECRSCSAMYLELVEVNDDLAGVLAPLLLGGLATGYLATSASGAAAGGIVALLDRAKDVVLAHIVPISAGTTAAGVAAAVVVAGGVGSGGRFVEPDPGSVHRTEAVDSPQHETRLPERVRPASLPSLAKRDAIAARQVQIRPGTVDAPGRPGNPTGTSLPGPDRRPSDTSSTEDPGVGTATTVPPATADDGDDADPRTAVARPTPSGPPPRDMRLSLSGSTLAKGIGRFRVQVSELPVASGPTPLHFTVGFTNDVHLERVPDSCTLSETDGGALVDCAGTSGGTWNGLFDADMRALDPGESVTITVTVSSESVEDENQDNNTGSITLTRFGTG